MNVVSIKKNSKTARNSINHTQPLPPYIVMVLTKHIANIKLSLLVKTNAKTYCHCFGFQSWHFSLLVGYNI